MNKNTIVLYHRLTSVELQSCSQVIGLHRVVIERLDKDDDWAVATGFHAIC